MTLYSVDLESQRPRCFCHLLSTNLSRPPCSLTPCPGLLPTAALQCTEQGPREPLTFSALTPHVSRGHGIGSGWEVTPAGLLEDTPGAMFHARDQEDAPLAWCGLNDPRAALRVVEEPGEMASPSGSQWESGAKEGPACLGSPSMLGTLRVSLISLTRHQPSPQETPRVGQLGGSWLRPRCELAVTQV